MQPKQRLPWDLEHGLIAFQVRPDWYEDYWLKPGAPAETKWRREKIVAYATFALSILFVLVATFWTEHESQTLARADATSASANIKSASIADTHRRPGQK